MRILSKRLIASDPIKLKDFERSHVGMFAILTSYRRGKGEPGLHDNKIEFKKFTDYLDSKGYTYKEAKGHWGAPEKSVMINNMPYAEARQLAEKYNQDAFIHKNQDGPVTMYNLKQQTAKPLEKIDMALVQDQNADAKNRLKTKFKNLGFNYDFSKRPLHLTDGPITWARLEDMAHSYQQALALEHEPAEEPESKYKQKLSKR